MLQLGLIKKWKSKYWPPKDRCSSAVYSGTGTKRTVDIGDMQGCFYLLLFGCFMALLILLCEKYLHYQRKMKLIGTLKIIVESKQAQLMKLTEKNLQFLR